MDVINVTNLLILKQGAYPGLLGRSDVITGALKTDEDMEGEGREIQSTVRTA